jgi:hypothetical protein
VKGKWEVKVGRANGKSWWERKVESEGGKKMKVGNENGK